MACSNTLPQPVSNIAVPDELILQLPIAVLPQEIAPAILFSKDPCNNFFSHIHNHLRCMSATDTQINFNYIENVIASEAKVAIYYQFKLII